MKRKKKEAKGRGTKSASPPTTRKKSTKAPKPYHHGDLRRTLVEAALELIREGPVENLSLRNLARKAGVTYAAPYHHFADKDALLAVVAEEGFRRLTATLQASVEKAGSDHSARLRALGEAYVQFAITHASHYSVMFRPELWERGEFKTLKSAGDSAFECLFNTVLAAVGEERAAEAHVVSLTAWSSVHGLALLWSEGALRYKLDISDPAPIIREVVRVLTRVV